MKIDPWDEGPVFQPVVCRRQRRGERKPRCSMVWNPDDDAWGQTVKPVGFYVTYSYTLFRKRSDSQDSLFAFY